MKRHIQIIYFIIIFILFNNIRILASQHTLIPENAVEFEGHYYKLYELNMSWENAQEYFKNIKGHLATITSQKENDFIYNYIRSIGYESAYFGATDKENEGILKWVTNENFVYNNWHNNEPNNEYGNEHYGLFYYKYLDGTWNDGGTDTFNANLFKTPYICEWDNDIIQSDSNVTNETEIISPVNNIIENFNINFSIFSFSATFSVLGGIIINIIKKNNKK